MSQAYKAGHGLAHTNVPYDAMAYIFVLLSPVCYIHSGGMGRQKRTYGRPSGQAHQHNVSTNMRIEFGTGAPSAGKKPEEGDHDSYILAKQWARCPPRSTGL